MSGIPTELSAAVLTEAIPYMRRFAGKVVVVKYGGNALAGTEGEDAALASFAEDVVLMRSVGMLPVVVHGGGPQIGELMGKLGKTPRFVDGLRVTDAETLEIVRMVLVGKINRDVVGAINVHGPLAVGLSGEDAAFIRAEPHDAALGYVGDVVSVDPALPRRLLAEGLVPVVATIGADSGGQAYNINADTVAGEVAAALGSEKLVFLTDVPGICSDRDDPKSVVGSLDVGGLEALIDDGIVSGGMIPKAQACIVALRGGVASAHILDGRVAHALLVELFTEEGVGTMVVSR